MQTVKTHTTLIGENVTKTLNYSNFFVFSETLHILLLQRIGFKNILFFDLVSKSFLQPKGWKGP